MTFTILGAKGFIGSRLSAALQKQGHNCDTPERSDDSIFQKDLGTVFYCIGLTNDFKDRPFDTINAHVTFLSKILEKASFKRLIYLSSTRLYDGSASKINLEPDDLTLNPANPRHLFDLSKALGENLCLNYSQGHACVARLSSVYDKTADATGFLSLLLQHLQKKRSYIWDAASGTVRDYIHVDDTVQALIKLADQTGIVNIASGENISNQDIVNILNQNGCDIKLQSNSALETPSTCDIQKIKRLGIKPVSLKSYLEDFAKGIST